MPSRFIFPLLVLPSLLVGSELELPLSKIEAQASASVSTPAKGLVAVRIAGGSKGFPGAAVQPPSGGFFNLSAHSRVEAVVRNTGTVALPLTMRIDNPGHWKKQPYSAESIRLNPGDSKTIVVFFGRKFGFQKDYPLDPSRIRQILFFTEGAEKERSFQIESMVAAGEPGETPEAWQKSTGNLPEDGVLLGATRAVESTSQIRAVAGAAAKLSPAKNRVAIRFSGPGQQVQFRPLSGRWNLRSATQLEIEILNRGTLPAQPRVRVESRKGSRGSSATRIEAGQRRTVLVPFARPEPWRAGAGTTSGSEFDSYRVERISIQSGEHSTEQNIDIVTIQVTAPVADLPLWVGKTPPVGGDWNLTFREEFEGDSVDESKWNVYSENHWDKRSHFSKKNVLVGNGVARLRFESKEGHHNDDPGAEATAWQTGFLDTYGKWRQRYGYFEARVKLPTAPGLWPAFWAMPDRGSADGPKWKRSQTSRGGMEFDIVEHLTRWGPHRYNVAFHWDGYGEDHKKVGTSSIYTELDRNGFITAGLLWLPGQAVYYCNGRVVARWDSPRISKVPSILMFTHVSGGWDNDPLETPELPDDFIIDYVRVWQRGDLVE